MTATREKEKMREIKFRGKRIDNDKWVYGYYVKHEIRQLYPLGKDSLKDDEILHLIVKSGFADWGMPKRIEFLKVIPKTVEQYTGLKDVHGVEIYEGDTVKISPVMLGDIHIGVVEFIGGMFIIKLNDKQYAELYSTLTDTKFQVSKIEKVD